MMLYVLAILLVLALWWTQHTESYTSNDIEIQKRRMEYIKRLADDILRDIQSPTAPSTVSENWYYGRLMNDVLRALKRVYPTKNVMPVEASIFKRVRFDTSNTIIVVWQWSSSATDKKRTVIQVVGMPPPVRMSIPNVIGMRSEDAVNQLKIANPGALVRRVSSTESYSVDYVPNRITVVHDASNIVLRILQN